MKRLYGRLLALGLTLQWLLSLSAAAQVTAWRPFRPGLVYAFRTAKADTLFTLRVDSLSVNGPDSVYHFNRTVRVLRFNRYVPTTNNLFGARMQFRPGSGTYTFYLDADVLGSARQWTLHTGGAVGSSYKQPELLSQPASLATALSRETRQILPGVHDEVLTLRTAPDEDSLVFSRQYGAVQLPRHLYGSRPGSRPLYLAEMPVPISESRYYSAAKLFDFQPGDEFGYKSNEISLTPFPCSETLTLRRIMTRLQTADSLIYTYLEQRQHYTLSVGAPGCATTPANTVSPITRSRLAISRRTGRSPQHRFLGLFTLEPAALSRDGGHITSLVMGLPIQGHRALDGCADAGPLASNVYLYGRHSLPGGAIVAFGQVADAGCIETFAAGIGELNDCSKSLSCIRRQLPEGQRTECGTCNDFNTLLPTRAAQATRAATLHPNPATNAATLTLAAPTQPGAMLLLADALGRAVWSRPVLAGQTALPVPLAGCPAGLYLVRLLLPGSAPLAWKLNITN